MAQSIERTHAQKRQTGILVHLNRQGYFTAIELSRTNRFVSGTIFNVCFSSVHWQRRMRLYKVSNKFNQTIIAHKLIKFKSQVCSLEWWNEWTKINSILYVKHFQLRLKNGRAKKKRNLFHKKTITLTIPSSTLRTHWNVFPHMAFFLLLILSLSFFLSPRVFENILASR